MLCLSRNNPSFPTRERGLKLFSPVPLFSASLSFPTRERGLKFYREFEEKYHFKSFPTRERGLKYSISLNHQLLYSVVPHAGTWIEIKAGREYMICALGRSPRGNVD